MGSSVRIATSESVTEGHPDKVCDLIVDAVLDAHLAGDPGARVACEALCKSSTVILAGEISSAAEVDAEAVVRRTIREIGYDEPAFDPETVRVESLLTEQAPEIKAGVDGAATGHLGAGDQGIMIGYATAETPERLPLPVVLAHGLARGLAEDRRAGREPWLRPDGKTQVSVRYEDGRAVGLSTVVVSAQHEPGVEASVVDEYVRVRLMPRIAGHLVTPETRILVNPAGSFVQGGPGADCGLSGRKNIVDTYGGLARHGGGSFSGKDPTKVDRSAAYFARWVARQLVCRELAARVEVEVAYAIGRAEPVALAVHAFGTGDDRACLEFARHYDFRPEAIIERFDLRRPIYRATTNYGHFGKPDLPWEQDE